MGSFFEIQADEFGNLAAVFERIARDADDLGDPLYDSAKRIQERTIENFETEGGLTDFGFWVPLATPYEMWKDRHHPGHQILHLEGTLEDAVRDPFAVIVEGDESRYTINDEKAVWHQFGAERDRGGTLPPRPIIPSPDDLADDVEHIFWDWAMDTIEVAVRDMPFQPGHPWWRPRSSIGTFLHR